MDCRSPSITRLQLAMPSVVLPSGGLFLAVDNPSVRRSRYLQPESKFEQALKVYWKTTRAPSGDALFGVDPLVLPYLAHFCAIAKVFPKKASCDLLGQIAPNFNTNDLDLTSLHLSICSELLDSIEEERNAEREVDELSRVTTCLEVRNKLFACVASMKEKFASERILIQLQGPLEVWRSSCTQLYAHAASVDDFQAKCQNAFDVYRKESYDSLMDAQADIDNDLLKAVESSPSLNLNAGSVIQFRSEIAMMSGLYADTHLEGDKTSVPYTAYSPAQCAIETYVLSQSSLPSLSGRYPEDPMKVALWKQNLIDYFDFDYFSAEQLLKQVHRFG